MNKYFQEFKLNPTLFEHIKRLNLSQTVARNMADESSYALTLNCLELLNHMEETFKKAEKTQWEAAENALEEMADKELQIIEINHLEFILEGDTYQGLVQSKELKMVVPKSKILEQTLEDMIIKEAPELFWMIHKDSPVMNIEARRLALQIQYFNQIIKMNY